MNSILENWHYFVGGAATLLAAVLTHRLTKSREAEKSKKDSSGTPSITINNNQNNLNASPLPPGGLPASPGNRISEEPAQKASKDFRILFIDDDTRFRAVKIISKAGWPNVRIVKDIAHLNSPDVLDTDIFFIDIQGVGKAMQFADEGLGLASAIKKKYPLKKVVIYSAQTTGERFHEALRSADYSLPKNAEPFEFIQLVERWTQNS